MSDTYLSRSFAHDQGKRCYCVGCREAVEFIQKLDDDALEQVHLRALAALIGEHERNDETLLIFVEDERERRRKT